MLKILKILQTQLLKHTKILLLWACLRRATPQPIVMFVLSGVRFVRGLVNVDAVVGQRVVLSCVTSQDVLSVDWLKNDEHLSRDAGCQGYEMLDSGRDHSLTILTASLSDEAKYTCSCSDDVTSCLVLVEGTSGSITMTCFKTLY